MTGVASMLTVLASAAAATALLESHRQTALAAAASPEAEAVRPPAVPGVPSAVRPPAEAAPAGTS